MSLFAGLEIGKRALSAHQAALQVIANNIANADTEGYSRQLAVLTTTEPVVVPVDSVSAPNVPIGTGSELSRIERQRDAYLDEGIRDITSKRANYDMVRHELEGVEVNFNEPSDTGLSSQFDKFWSSWQNLYSPDPSNSGARAEVRASAIILCDSLQRIYRDLRQAKDAIDGKVNDRVKMINQYATDLANVNFKIAGQSLLGAPNDLMDQRDLLLEKLAKLTNIEISIDSRNVVNVSVGGTLLVGGVNVFKMSTTMSASGVVPIWENSNAPVVVTGGEIRGLQDVRDVNIGDYIDTVNNIAIKMISKVNAQHKEGFDQNSDPGLVFFKGSNANDIRLNEEIEENLSKIAASGSRQGSNGNGANALQMSLLRDEKVFDSNTQSVEDYYISMLTDLGSVSGESKRLRENQDILLNQLTTRRQSVSGVSIDEEMTDMLKLQTGYQASAKYVRTISDLVDVLLGIIR